MRVEVAFELEEGSSKLEIPWASTNPGGGYLDLREEPSAAERIEPARQHLPLRSFLLAVNSGDSLFATARCKTWTSSEPSVEEPSATEKCQFSSEVDVVFAREPLNFERSRYEDLAKRLEELLTREAGTETQRAALCVRLCRYRTAGRWGFAMAVRLVARGSTAEQARLRWGLGLARVQQALLFVSRVLRQQIAQAS